MKEIPRYNPIEQQQPFHQETEEWKLPQGAQQEIDELVYDHLIQVDTDRVMNQLPKMTLEESISFNKNWVAEGRQIYIMHLAKVKDSLNAEGEKKLLREVLEDLDQQMALFA
jgi:hypothetical protein